MSAQDPVAERFEQHRERLGRIAVRILGSQADAEDAVQETWLRFSRSDTAAIGDLGAWLATVVSRVCLTMLQARAVRPQTSAGLEAVEQVAGAADSEPEHAVLLGDSVGLALDLVLERLTPAERVAFVLHDVFAFPFDHIAPIVGRSVPAARQLASRARARVRRQPAATRQADALRTATLVDGFLAAARDGDFGRLLSLLDPDVVLRADAHVVALGVAPELHGAEDVAVFARRARGAIRALLDGVAVAVWLREGRPRVVYSLTTDGDRIVAIDLIGDPDRLGGLRVADPSAARPGDVTAGLSS